MQTFRNKILGTAVLCAFIALPLTACGQAAGSPSTTESTERLPDEPGTEPVNNGTEAVVPPTTEPEPVVTPQQQSQILSKYDYLDPNHIVPTDLLQKAVTYFDANLAKIPNQNYLSVINFGARSTQARFFIIDMKTGKVWAIHVAHGRGSDSNGYATAFSNASGSNMSSLGVYKTAETYDGEHGLSLRLDGLSSTNSNVRARAIVIHGADYVVERSVVQGRSLGCPAVAMANHTQVVNELKGGSIIYAGVAGK